MVEIDNTPSVMSFSHHLRTRYVLGQHTHDPDDLAFESELVLEAASKVFHAATPVAAHIRRAPDMVEHVTAAEEEDGKDRCGSPYIAILQHRQCVGVENSYANDRSDANGRVCYEFHPLKRSFKDWLGCVLWKLFRDPRVNHLGRSSSKNH